MGKARASRKQTRTNNNYNKSNVVEMNTFQKKKTVVTILPRNKNQETYVLKLMDASKDIVFGIGPAGTGKTLLAVQVAVKCFKEGLVDKIIVTRPAVSVDEDLGALPGTLEVKMSPWTRPVFDVLREYFDAREIEGMIEEGVIEIAPLSYMRGRTFKNSYIIADEMQLSTPSQMRMLLTRLGEGSYMAVTGDLDQADRGPNNGLLEFLEKAKIQSSQRISILRFSKTDIERHPVVQDVLDIYDVES
jgi:phosphate starvation-inducible PhoH-like protein